MRKRYKIMYWVQDTGRQTSIWYVDGKGWVNNPGQGSGARSNVKQCHTQREAMRHCRRINLLGGRGLIERHARHKGRRTTRKMWFRDFPPWE